MPIKHYRDSITNKLQDSLKNYQLKIDIPTLNTIEVELDIGIPIWMSLATFFMVMMFSNRDISFKYLQKCLKVYYDKKADRTHLDHLDASIPFWMHPFKLQNRPVNGRKLHSLIQNHQPALKTVLIIGLIIILLILQFRTTSLIWNKHEFWNHYQKTLFESAYISRAICFFMLSVSVVISLLWVIPKKLNVLTPDHENILNTSRRKFLIVGGLMFTVQFLKPIHLLSNIEAKAFNYRRKKPVKENTNVFAPTFSGFYINSRKKNHTIHYFSENGKNVMFKTIAKENGSKFLNNLKKINIFDYFPKIKEGNVGFPHSVWALEMAAENSKNSGNFHEALLLLQNAIEINFFNQSRIRLTSKFKKDLKAFDNDLSKDKRRQFKVFLSSTEKKAKEINKYISDMRPRIR